MREELPFPVIDVTAWDVTDEETSGAEAKFWLEEPGTRVRWLLKSVTVKAGHVHGEDWAEKAASHLGRLLGVPCARVELAVWREDPGCISKSLRPRSYQMQPGGRSWSDATHRDTCITARVRTIRATRLGTFTLR